MRKPSSGINEMQQLERKIKFAILTRFRYKSNSIWL